MPSSFSLESARTEDLERVFTLLFSSFDEPERGRRVADCLTLVLTGELPQKGIFVARREDELLAVQICIPLGGASAVFWIPFLKEGEPEFIQDALVEHVRQWLQHQGTRVAQMILSAADLPLAAPLLRHGFQHVTGLWYLRHDLELPAEPPLCLRVEPYSRHNHPLFLKTLGRTYEGTLDCPELTGKRTVEQILEGHRQQGNFRPDLWWLAWKGEQPAGVCLITEIPGGEGWDLSYLGVIPSLRNQGVAKELTYRVLAAAQGAWVPQLLCSVDRRNTPARQLYRKMGFFEIEEREVLLSFFQPLDSIHSS